jgi:hypothetical protein
MQLQRVVRTRSRVAILLLPVVACLSGARFFAQSTSGTTETIRGSVIDSVTREPIARALVFSSDNRFATMTNSEGRFEFVFAKDEPAAEGNPNVSSISSQDQRTSPGPPMLMARKPGYLADREYHGQNLLNEALQDLTLELTPESLIVGTVTLPTAEAPDRIFLQILRRDVQDGRARWVPAGGTQSTSKGHFRFADLPAGAYKLLTHELLDHDPLTIGPRASDPRGALFGYPPVYFESASDFGSASAIELSAGQTRTVNVTLVKQPYYRVSVPVISRGTDAPENRVNVEVYAHGHKGPGFSLGFNNLHHAIEGSLPNGTYAVEASRMGSTAMTGVQTIVIKGAPIDGPSLTLVPSGAITVNVKEEFTSPVNSTSSWNINGRTIVAKGPRRYLNAMLDSADQFGLGQTILLRNPTGAADDGLVFEGAPVGSYWVRVTSGHGYPASIRSGNVDLLHQPLVVGAGGGVSPIEITMRDDTAEINGTVEGVTARANGLASTRGEESGMTSYSPNTGQATVLVYCIPLADSSGQFAEIYVSPDGSFISQMAPGAYRLLAFDHVQRELEYRNLEAMRAYDSKGPVVRVVGGQKERVQLQLISSGSVQ